VARRVQGPPPGREAWFTPVAFGNAKALPEDRIRVKLRYPTEGDRRRASSAAIRMEMGTAQGATGDGPVVVKGGSVEQQIELILTEHVVEVEGYEDAAGRPITTGAQLYEYGERDIADEVYTELRAGLALQEVEKKTSDESPASPPPTPVPSDGTAPSAESSAPTSSEDTTQTSPTSSQ